MILISTTMGVFVILTIFAYYLARFSITENRSSGYYLLDIKARSLALSGLSHSLELFKVNRDISNTIGRINKGDFVVSKISSKSESGSDLTRSHYFTIQSKAKIDDVERNVRCIVSSVPEAFCFAFYGNNDNNQNPSLNAASNGIITGDVFYNGDISSGNGSDNGTNYTTTGVGGTSINNQPDFPSFEDSQYEALLTTASNLNTSNIALDLDGANISISGHDDINLISHPLRTIELWFKVNNKSTGSYQTLYEEGGSGRGISIYIDPFGVLYGGGWNRNESQWMGNWIESSNITNNNWHHVALTLNGGSSISDDALKMYLDGNFINFAPGSQLWRHSANIKVGKNGGTRFYSSTETSIFDGSSGEYFYGSIDEFRIWNIERSLSDISTYMTFSLGGNDSGLVTYYNFENQTADDQQSDSNNDGSLSNPSSNYSWEDGLEFNISFSNSEINLNNYDNNVLYIDRDALISNSTIIGPGKIVVYGDLTINSSTFNSSNNGGGVIFIICNNNLEISDSNMGLSLNDYIITYSKNGFELVSNAEFSKDFYGLTISKGSNCVIENIDYYGAIFSESSNLNLKENSNIEGSIVSKYTINISADSVSISKGNLPLFVGQDIGLKPSVIPGSFLEY